MTIMLAQRKKEKKNLQKNFPFVENCDATENATWCQMLCVHTINILKA